MHKIINTGLRGIVRNTMDRIAAKEDPMEELTIEDIVGEQVPENQPILMHFQGSISNYGGDIYFIDKDNIDGSFGWNRLDSYTYSATKRIKLINDCGFPSGYVVDMTYFKNKYIMRYNDTSGNENCARIYTSLNGENWKEVDYGDLPILTSQYSRLHALEDVLIISNGILTGFVYTNDLVTFTYVPFDEAKTAYASANSYYTSNGRLRWIAKKGNGNYLMMDNLGTIWETEDLNSFKYIYKGPANQTISYNLPIYSEFDKRFIFSNSEGSQYTITDEENSEYAYWKYLQAGRVIPYGDGAAIVGTNGFLYARTTEINRSEDWSVDWGLVHTKAVTVPATNHVHKYGDKYFTLGSGMFGYTTDEFVTLTTNRVANNGYNYLSGMVVPSVDSKVQINN